MDSCEWSATTGEVIDQQGEYNATAYNEAKIETAKTAGGGLCRVGSFDANKKSYINAGKPLKEYKKGNSAGEITVSAWIKPTGDNRWAVIAIQADADWKEGFHLYRDENGRVCFSIEDWYRNSVGVAVDKNVWTHVVGTYNGKYLKIYINGEKKKVKSVKNKVIASDYNFMIGDSEWKGVGDGNDLWNGYIDEVKVFSSALTAKQVEELYDKEKAGKNFDDTQRVCQCCYKFDAWDTFRDKNDRNISTKIVNQDFNLTIASLKCDGSDYRDFNGTVCVTVEDSTVKLDFRDQNVSTATFKISKPVRDTRVYIAARKNADASCPLIALDAESNSTDNFAIRPDRFVIDVNNTIPLKNEEFHIDINATDIDGVNVQDYNETNGTTFSFEVDARLRGQPNPFEFSDGSISFDTKISELGDVVMQIAEINGSEFAVVDADDTNDSLRLITPAIWDELFVIFVRPVAYYRFDVCPGTWNGTAGEVKDYSGYDHNGTAHNVDTTEGEICQGADLRADSDNDYIKLDGGAMDSLKNFTVTMWIKTTDTGGQALLSGAKDNTFSGSNEALLYLVNDTTIRPHIKNKHVDITLPKSVADGTWHQIAWVRNGQRHCIYVDGDRRCRKIRGSDGAVTIDKDGLYLGQDQDSLGGGFDKNQDFEGLMDEVNIYDKRFTKDAIKQVYRNEKAKKNYDGTDRNCTNCNVTPPPPPVFSFDAWDSFRNINDRNISTKLCGDGFVVSIASLKEDGSDFQEFNGTVCSALVDRNSNLVSAWHKNLFVDENLSSQTAQGNPTFNVAKALDFARVKIVWKENVDEACPVTNETNSTLSSDAFAIRPKRFAITGFSSALYAGEEFDVEFHAFDGSGSDVVDYNESEGGSFDVNVTELKPQCREGNFSVSLKGWRFEDGNKTLRTSYSEVGQIKLSIREKEDCLHRFASIDCDDKNVSGSWDTQSGTAIEPQEVNITFGVHHFEVNATVGDFKQGSFTYLCNLQNEDANMSADINITVAAKNEQNVTTRNFTSECYAKDVDINLTHSNVGTTNLDNLLYFVVDANATQSALQSVAKNDSLSFTYAASNFSSKNTLVDENGTSVVRLRFNFDRNFTKVVEPFKFTLSGINVANSDANSSGYEQRSGDATFYYGRTYAKDLYTSSKNDSTLLKVLVYGKDTNPLVSGMDEVLLGWYYKNDHTSENLGKVAATRINDSTTLKTNAQIPSGTSFEGNGSYTIDVNNTAEKTGVYFIHLDISKWLWYAPEGFGETYRYEDGNSSCLNHPCIKYVYQKKSQGKKVQSGSNFKPLDIYMNIQNNNRGIRLLR